MDAQASIFLSALVCMFAVTVSNADPADTTVLKWKDGKKACFMLGFDDSAPSQLKNAIPELEKRKMVGTFYLVTGNKLYAALKRQWEAAAKSPSVVVANHTFTHQGVNNAEELEPELAKCNEVLYALHPERKQPYLLAFGKPGGVPWKVTEEEWNAGLLKHNLINRPPFAGPPINYKSAEETIAVVDKALAKGDMGYHVFHGVGGDWLTTPMDWFTALLDYMEKHRNELWITDLISWHKYVRERDSAEVKVIESAKDHVRLSLTSQMGATLYDEPLTLRTQVPADWKNCTVKQDTTEVRVAAREGVVQYDAIPGRGEITIHPVQ